MESFNWRLCQERHEDIKKEEVEVSNRLKKVENRWLLLMAAHVATLGGIIAILITK